MNLSTAPQKTALDGSGGVDRYEELRRYVLGEAFEPELSGVGLAVFKRAGLRAWLEATQEHEWQMARPAQPRAGASPARSSIAQVDEVDIELARVVVAMALEQVQQEGATACMAKRRRSVSSI